jgi:hypothetical protein
MATKSRAKRHEKKGNEDGDKAASAQYYVGADVSAYEDEVHRDRREGLKGNAQRAPRLAVQKFNAKKKFDDDGNVKLQFKDPNFPTATLCNVAVREGFASVSNHAIPRVRAGIYNNLDKFAERAVALRGLTGRTKLNSDDVAHIIDVMTHKVHRAYGYEPGWGKPAAKRKAGKSKDASASDGKEAKEDAAKVRRSKRTSSKGGDKKDKKTTKKRKAEKDEEATDDDEVPAAKRAKVVVDEDASMSESPAATPTAATAATPTA